MSKVGGFFCLLLEINMNKGANVLFSRWKIASREDKTSKKNKLACSFIRSLRVIIIANMFESKVSNFWYKIFVFCQNLWGISANKDNCLELFPTHYFTNSSEGENPRLCSFSFSRSRPICNSTTAALDLIKGEPRISGEMDGALQWFSIFLWDVALSFQFVLDLSVQNKHKNGSKMVWTD